MTAGIERRTRIAGAKAARLPSAARLSRRSAWAIVAAGSVITGDVERDALAMARGRQEQKTGWAKRFREAMQVRKDKR